MPELRAGITVTMPASEIKFSRTLARRQLADRPQWVDTGTLRKEDGKTVKLPTAPQPRPALWVTIAPHLKGAEIETWVPRARN